MTEAERHLTSLLMRLTLTRREAKHWRDWAAEQQNAELVTAVNAVEAALVEAEAAANRAALVETEATTIEGGKGSE